MLYDVLTYNQTAVTLPPAERPDDPPFWACVSWLGLTWTGAPYLAAHPRYGEFLVVPGRHAGTGSFAEDRVVMPDHARGWTEIRAATFDPVSGVGWIEALKAHLPPGHGIWNGLRIEYATLTGTTPVWLDGNANRCLSVSELRFRLRIDGPGPGLMVDGAE